MGSAETVKIEVEEVKEMMHGYFGVMFQSQRVMENVAGAACARGHVMGNAT